MKIKWKFQEEREKTDEYGNLKPYYKDAEPWKKPSPKPNLFYQILKIVIALIFCGIIIAIAFTYQGYDWNQSGFIRLIRDLIYQRGWI